MNKEEIPEFKSIDSFFVGGRKMHTIINDKDRKAGSGGRCELTGMEIILDGKKGKIIGAEFFCTAYPMHYKGQPSCILFKEDEV